MSNNTLALRTGQRFESEKHVFIEEINKIAFRPGSGSGYAPPRQANKSSTTRSQPWY